MLRSPHKKLQSHGVQRASRLVNTCTPWRQKLRGLWPFQTSSDVSLPLAVRLYPLSYPLEQSGKCKWSMFLSSVRYLASYHGMPDLWLVSQKYRKPQTCAWHLKWGQSCDDEPLTCRSALTLGSQCQNWIELLNTQLCREIRELTVRTGKHPTMLTWCLGAPRVGGIHHKHPLINEWPQAWASENLTEDVHGPASLIRRAQTHLCLGARITGAR